MTIKLAVQLVIAIKRFYQYFIVLSFSNMVDLGPFYCKKLLGTLSEFYLVVCLFLKHIAVHRLHLIHIELDAEMQQFFVYFESQKLGKAFVDTDSLQINEDASDSVLCAELDLVVWTL